MDPENQPSTSKRANDLKKVSEKLNASNKYPVTFEEFRKFTNVENYVETEMKRSGPRIYDLNYHIRHKYYPAVYKNFYESKPSRDKMLRRGLKIKPIPKFLKDRLMQMPENETSSSDTLEIKPEKIQKLKVQFVETDNNKTSTATSSVCEKPPEIDINTIDKLSDKTVSKPSPKTINKSKSRTSIGNNKNCAVDSQKITHFFSSLNLLPKGENHFSKERKDVRKRKSEVKETSPTAKRNKNVDELPLSSKSLEINNKAPLSVANRKLIGPKSKRKTISEGIHNSKMNLNRPEKRENRRQYQNQAEDVTSDDSDIHSNIGVIDLNKTQNASHRTASSRNSLPLEPEKASLIPIPKRNRTEDFQEQSLTPIKSAVRVTSDFEDDSSDTEMALLSLSGAPKKVKLQESYEIQDWMSKSSPSKSESDNDCANFLEEKFTAVDKLRAIRKYPDDVRRYIKFLMRTEILKRKILNMRSEKRGNVSKSKIVAVFREMTFDDYKTLINADKKYVQGVSEERTHQEITADLRAQFIAIMNGERVWPKDHPVKLTTLRSFFRAKGLKDPVDLVYIPPRLLSFEEVLEHTNLKEHTSLSGSEPPASYKELLSLCKKTYLKCCAEGVWMDGVDFIDLNNEQEEMLQLTQCDITPTESQQINEVTEPAYEFINSNIECLNKDRSSSEVNQVLEQKKGQLSGGISITENQQNSNNKKISPIKSYSDNTVESMLDKMFNSQPSKTSFKESSENATEQVPVESQQNITLETPHSAKLPICQPMLGYIPPSPALFQSSGETEQRTQDSESQQHEILPPEGVFIPCDRSVLLNTEENNMTIMGVAFENNTTDPFAEPTRDADLQSQDISEQTQDVAVLKDVVKREPESRNNTQTSYNQWDDSVQILDIPPSEPITIEDEESAPELLNMLLAGPTSKDSCFVSSGIPLSTAPATPTKSTSPQTQTSPGTDTFVYAQRLPSHLYSTQSLLNPSQTHEDISKNRSPPEKGRGQEKDNDSLNLESTVKRELDRGIDVDVELDIHHIINILKSDPDETIKQSPSTKYRKQATTDSSNTFLDLVTLNEDHSYTNSCQKELSGRVFIPIEEIIQVDNEDLSLEEILNSINQIEESLNADNEGGSFISKETVGEQDIDNTTHANNNHTEFASICLKSTQNEISSNSEVISSSLNKGARNDVGIERNLIATLTSTEGKITGEKSDRNSKEGEMIDEQISSDLEKGDTFNEKNDLNSKDVGKFEKQGKNLSSAFQLLDESEKTKVATKDVNDNLSEELMHLSGSRENDFFNNQQLNLNSNLPVVNVETYVDLNQQPQNFVGEISNDLFIACNVEVNTTASQSDVSAKECDVESIQVEKRDNCFANNPLEVSNAGLESRRNEGHEIISTEVPNDEIETALARKDMGFDQRRTRSEDVAPVVSNEIENITPAEQPVASSQKALVCTRRDKEQHVEQPSNIENNIPFISIEHSTALLKSILTTDIQEIENGKVYTLPALLPIAALKSNEIDEFIENPEMQGDPETDDDKDDLVEVPILINRKLINMLPFNILTPQQIQQTTKESTIFALKTRLEFCLQEVGIISGAKNKNTTNKNETITIKQSALSGKQKIAAEASHMSSSATYPEFIKNSENITLRKRNRPTKANTDHCPQLSSEILAVSTDTKVMPLSNTKKKKLTPIKAAKKPTALDFVPQKTHPFRSLRLAAPAKKNSVPQVRTEKQTVEGVKSNTEVLNYSIEDVSQAIVASSTASQILGTDCTYFESSQLLRNIQGCCQAEDAQGPSAGHGKTLDKSKVNAFDRISLSEGLMARRIWQVNLNWKSKQKMPIEVQFSFRKKSLTVCNSSAKLLFNFSAGLWSDILRVLREIDHFEYKRLTSRNYQAATPLHKVLRHLFESAPQVVNVNLTIDSHDPYASCEAVKPLHRKPFQCLTKAIAPNILSQMRAKKASLKSNADN